MNFGWDLVIDSFWISFGATLLEVTTVVWTLGVYLEGDDSEESEITAFFVSCLFRAGAEGIVVFFDKGFPILGKWTDAEDDDE